MSSIRVGVLRGGPNSEYEVSLNTGKSVLSELAVHPDYTPIDIFIDKSGVWHIAGAPIEPADLHLHIDVAFNAMHGEYGGDGQVQQILENLKIPYTGSGILSSALAVHKVRAKEYFKKEKIPTPPGALFSIENDTEPVLREIFRTIPGPYIVRPIRGSSSWGACIAGSYPELHEAVYRVGQTYPEVLIEKLVKGRRAVCAVIDGFRDQELYALLPVEVVSSASGTSEICPGRFSSEETRMIQEYAQQAHMALSARDYSLSDLIVTPRGVHILETNPLPGLTSESLLSKSLEAVGSGIPEFLHHTISRAYMRR